MRTDQMLSRYGYCSRREAVAWVKAGRVSAGGEAVKRPDQKVRPDEVLVDGAPVPFPGGLLVAFHKPTGVTCSHDPSEGPLLYDLLPADWMRRQPAPVSVGRLDKETSGLILVTDDGGLVHRWTSPRHETEKVYEVTVAADLPEGIAEVFGSGTLVLRGEDKPCRPATLEVLGPRQARVRLTEGRYHQVRRMFASQGCPVTTLHRSAIGGLSLESLGLAPGEWREVSTAAVEGVVAGDYHNQ